MRVLSGSAVAHLYITAGGGQGATRDGWREWRERGSPGQTCAT